MPADFISRSNTTLAVNAIQLTARDLADQQGLDPDIQALKEFRASGRWPLFLPSYSRHAMQQLEPNFITIIHRRIWVKTTHKGQTRIFGSLNPRQLLGLRKISSDHELRLQLVIPHYNWRNTISNALRISGRHAGLPVQDLATGPYFLNAC